MTASERDQAGRTPESLERTVHTYRKAWENEKEKNVALAAEVERLREDSARLEWMVANYDEIEIGESERGWFVSRDNVDCNGLYPIAAGLPTLRAAVDAAIGATRTTGGRDAE